MQSLYINDAEYKMHKQAIQALSDQFHMNEARVKEVYEKILQELASKARLRKYLLVLTTRKVREFIIKFNKNAPA